MVEDIVIFKDAVAIVVEVDADLFARVDAIPAQHGRRTRGNPDAGQRVGVDLVLLDQPLALLVNVYTAMLAVMNFVVTNDWIAEMKRFNAILRGD